MNSLTKRSNIFDRGDAKGRSTSVVQIQREIGDMVEEAAPRPRGWLISLFQPDEAGKALARGRSALIAQSVELALAARREEIEHRLALGLDEAKKRAIAANMENTALIEREIAQMTATITQELIDGALDVSKEAALAEVRRVKELETALERGEITERRFQAEVVKIEAKTTELGDKADAVAMRVIENLGERLASALRTASERRG